MKISWNFLGGLGVQNKNLPLGSMNIFWNCTIFRKHTTNVEKRSSTGHKMHPLKRAGNAGYYCDVSRRR